MRVRGVGEEVVSLDTPGLLGVVQRLEVAGRGGVVDVDAELLVMAVDVVADLVSAVKRSIDSTTGCTITEKAPTRAFSWLKAATTAFTFKTLSRHYAKQALTPRSLNVKLGPRRKGHKGRAVWLA